MLNSIALKNFKCFYNEHFITFPEGLINIRGRINNNEELSNRSGKSSFLEAIRFALFREAAYKFISLEESDMGIELILNNTSLRHTESSSFVNEEKVLIAASKAASEALIGLDENMFLCTIGAFSDNLYGFLELKPKDQKELLLNNFNNSSYVWEDMQSVLRDEVEKLNTSRANIKLRISMIGERMQEISLDLYESKKEKLTIQLDSMIYELNSRNTSAKQYTNEYRYLIESLADLNKTKDSFMFNKERKEEKLNLLKKYDKELAEIEEAVTQYVTVPAYDKRINKLTKEKHTLEYTASELTKKIDAYTLSNKHCPILNEVCPYQSKLDKSFSSWVDELPAISKKLVDVDKQLKIETLNRQTMSNYASRIHIFMQNKTFIELELRELNTTVDIGVVLDNINTIEDKLEYLSKVMDTEYTTTLNDNIYTVKEQLKVIYTILEDYWKAKDDVDELNSKLFELDNNIRDYTTALKLVSPRGIPYLLLTKVLAELEIYTNKFLKKVDMKIYINGYVELKSLEDYCSNDGYKFKRNDTECPVCSSKRENKLQEEVTVISADTGVNWNMESSGGKALIALAVRFALLAMAKERKCTADFLILDEIFTNLDLRNKLAALDMIKSAAEELDIKQIFIVTHDELKDIIPPTFIVNNVGGRSTIIPV